MSPKVLRTQHPRPERGLIIGIFAFALVVRIAYLLQIASTPYFRTPIHDAQNYDLLAREILQGGGFSTQFFWQPVFYPLVLVAAYKLTSGSIVAVKLFQIILSSLNCGLTYALGRRLFDRTTGLIAAATLALYGPIIFYDAELLANVWAEFWVVLLLLLTREPPTRIWTWALIGVLGGLSTLTRPTFMPFVAMTCIWLAWAEYRRRPERAGTIRRVAVLATGLLIVAVPAALFCAQVTGHLTLMPASRGLNLYIGNNPRAEQMESLRGWEVIHLRHEAARQGHPDVWGEDAYFSSLAWQYLKAEPLAVARHWLRKASAFITSREIPSYEDVYLYRKWSGLMGLLAWKVGAFGFPFGVLLPLAMLGLMTRYRQFPPPFWLFLILDFVSITSAHVIGRTRTTVIPLLAVGAATGILWFAEAGRQRRWGKVAIGACTLIGVAAFATIPGPFGLEAFPSEAEAELSAGFYRQLARQPDAASDHYRRALELEPANASAHFNLAVLLASHRQHEEAIAHYRRAIDLAPEYPEFHYNLAGALTAIGPLEDATQEYRRTLDLDPTFAQAHYNLAYLLTDLKQPDEAIRHYRDAVRIDPRFTAAWVNLGLLLEERNDNDGAMSAYRAALQTSPGQPVASRALHRLETGVPQR